MATKLSEDQIKEIKEAFFMFDTNNKGVIETSKLGTAIRSLGMNPSEAEVKAMIKDADRAGKGFIDEKTFVETLSKHWKPVNTEADVIDAFKVFDKEGSGYIEAKQLKNVLMNLGEQMTEEEVADVIKIANLDADGQLHYSSLVQTLLAESNKV